MQVHVFNKELIYLGMALLKYLPVAVVDALVLFIAMFKYGDLTKYGITRPTKGPFRTKIDTGRSSIIDVGTIGKIKAGEIKACTIGSLFLLQLISMHIVPY